ncbi:MAG TPA: glycosyltransferase family A protein [Blastocatellia bacterium]|nr:glycosyltransferase family A protein [Blastocatellia bacterium]
MNQTTQNPFVSVVIPAYNGERFLAETIESVISQNYAPLEIIVVDNGSTDVTAKIAKEFGKAIRYFHLSPNQGAAVARNYGVRVSRGEWLGFLDHDDLWPANRLHTQIAYLKENPELEIITGRVQFEIMQGASLPEFIAQQIAVDTSKMTGGGLYKRSVFDRVGLFDPEMFGSEDTDWLLRCSEQGIKTAVLDQVAVIYRFHETNLVRETNFVSDKLIKALHKSLARRRAAGGDIQDLTEWQTILKPDQK